MSQILGSPGRLLAEATAAPSAEFDAKSSKFEQESKSASGHTQFTCMPELDHRE
jgi:hypothetical protein